MLRHPFILCNTLLFALVAQSAPTVKLDGGTFQGSTNGTVSKFLGIPFGKSTAPPNRFRRPQLVDPYTGVHKATTFGPACPQQDVTSGFTLPTNFPQATTNALVALIDQLIVTGPTSEDCLSVNVITPAGAKTTDELPVVAWIFGGGFEVGGSANYDGSAIVSRSVALKQPIIFVSMNYRLAAWGFIGGAQVNGAGVSNLGLRDQRLALQWIQKYISAFGGDPSKVTIWGESAGSISASLQMLTNGGSSGGLYRAAFLESGSPYPVGNASLSQPFYDRLVVDAGCATALDTLNCLANVPLAKLTAAINLSPNFFQTLNQPWVPRVDGDFIPETPYKLISAGQVAPVPFVNGDCDDEGTAFSLNFSNITTEAELEAFVSSNEFPAASSGAVKNVAALYPANPAVGSPFGTGSANALSSQFKRIAAIQGDYAFHSNRRFLLKNRASHQTIFSYLTKRNKFVPILGASHASDLPQFFVAGELQDYLIHFVTGLDPNHGSALPHWPQYSLNNTALLTLWDTAPKVNVTQDTFRAAGIDALTALVSQKI
ncbi:carotenoid ester lipase precursor [Rickenella mellea]|uniref:Carboxylic ester hydrolase n=1 Tax=Rickenella mellea TaxID=50990 RepID=A0A4Y7PX29_9AGAM|nr:carotenoid ester lipase precursor [Rickenella mellea]